MDGKTLVIIPCLNEEKNIQTVIQKVKKSLRYAKVLVVDDGSIDKTRQLALANGVQVISHPFNLGYGVALQTGYRYAHDNHFDFVCQLDGDDQHFPEFLPELLKLVRKGNCDLALGSRFLGRYSYDMQFIRRLGILLFNRIIFFSTGQKITDPTSGFQAMNKKVIQYYISDIYPVDYPDADVLIMAAKKGFHIKELAVKMHPSDQSKLHSGFKPLYYAFKMFLSISMTLLRD